jgi:hypothetical protein
LFFDFGVCHLSFLKKTACKMLRHGSDCIAI